MEDSKGKKDLNFELGHRVTILMLYSANQGFDYEYNIKFNKDNLKSVVLKLTVQFNLLHLCSIF